MPPAEGSATASAGTSPISKKPWSLTPCLAKKRTLPSSKRFRKASSLPMRPMVMPPPGTAR